MFADRIQNYAKVTHGPILDARFLAAPSRRTGGKGETRKPSTCWWGFRGYPDVSKICLPFSLQGLGDADRVDSDLAGCERRGWSHDTIRLWPSAPYAQVSCGYPRSITGECGLSSCREFASKLGWTWLGGSVVQYAQEGFSGRAEQIARLLAYPNLERS